MFSITHPAVTATIISPRTLSELRGILAGASLELDDKTLDCIDEIVEPGRDVNAADAGWRPPAITELSSLCRAMGDRGAL